MTNKSEYTYADDGNLLVQYDYIFSDSLFEFSIKSEYSYDFDGNMSMKVVYEWDSEADTWVGTQKNEYSFDSDKNKICDIFYHMDTDQWVPGYKTDFSFDSFGNEDFHLISYWNASDDWDVNEKADYSYDATGNITSLVFLSWHEDIKTWVKNYRTSYTYSDDNNIYDPEAIHVYPVPARDYIIFNLPDISESASIDIINREGKILIRQALGKNGQVSVSQLQNGIYIYWLINKGTIYCGKFIKAE